MSDDLETRAEEFEQKVISAGSTEGIIGGLMKGIEKNDRIIKWLSISLVSISILTLLFAGLVIVAFNNGRNVEKQSDETKQQATISCVQSVQNSIVINQFLDLLIENTKISDVLTPVEKADRIAGYEKLIIKIPNC